MFMIKKISLPITENTSVFYGNIFCQFIYKKKNIFRILLLYKTSIELVKKPACKTNLDENEIVLHSILLFFHLKAVE